MKIKLDENLPESLLTALAELGHDLDNVRKEHLVGQDDKTVWKASQEAERFFITQDLDFSDIRIFEPGSHQGLMLVRLRTPGRLGLEKRVKEVFESENIAEWKGCFVIATDLKIRIHRPPA